MSGFLHLGIARRLLPALLTFGAFAGSSVSGLAQQPAASGQILHANGPLPSFEVATIKRNLSGSGPAMIGAAGHAAPKDRFIATNMPIKGLICWAFGGTSIPLPNNEVSGGPSWIESERYDVNAKLEDSQAAKLAELSEKDQIVQVRLMVQSLLADRFKLVANDTMVNRPVYALVIAKAGSKLQETVPGSRSPIQDGGRPMQFSGHRGELSGHGIPISFLVRFLSQGVLDRPVVDETGLKGEYDLELKWNADFDAPNSGSAPADVSGPSIFTAIQDQLGLKLKATEAPLEKLVIVGIERPSEN
jgi:bla regulator protein blaR1